MTAMGTLITLEEACALLHYKKQTLYNKVRSKEIPHYRKGNRLWFDTQELEAYIRSGRVRTEAEVRKIANNY